MIFYTMRQINPSVAHVDVTFQRSKMSTASSNAAAGVISRPDVAQTAGKNITAGVHSFVVDIAKHVYFISHISLVLIDNIEPDGRMQGESVLGARGYPKLF